MQEVKFKSTDIGLIPEDWDMVTLGSLMCKIGSGVTPTGGSAIYTKVGHIFVRSQNVGWGVFGLDDVAFIDEDTHQNQKSTELQEGDILLNITGASIGRSAVVDSTVAGGNVNQHVCILRLKDPCVDSNYICYSILTSGCQKQIMELQNGGSREGLNFKQVADILIALPHDKHEQWLISKAISDNELMIRDIEDLLAKKRNIRAGVFHDLISGVKRLSVNSDWTEESLGSLFNNIPTANYTRDELTNNGPVKYIHYGDIHTKFGNVVECDKTTLPTVSLEQGDKYQKLIDGDLIMADASEDYEGIGKSISIIANGCQVISGLHTILLRKKDADKFDNEFLSYLFASRFVKQQIEDFAEGTKVYSISYNKIAEVIIRYPQDKDEQHLIAHVLSDMDAEIQALEEEKEKYINIKQGMMQQLLTGKIRLI